MTDSGNPGKPKLLSRHYLLDCPSQISFCALVLSVLAGIGILYAAAVFYLLDTDLLRDRTVAEMRLALLIIHTGYFVIGGAILFVTVLLLTHRYVGPAHVMRRAVEHMRRGDFTARLALRRHDYHKSIAEELRLLRDELAERDDALVVSLKRLERCLDEGDELHARGVIKQIREGSASARAQRVNATDAAA